MGVGAISSQILLIYKMAIELILRPLTGEFLAFEVFLLNVIVRVVKMWNIFISMLLCMSPA